MNRQMLRSLLMGGAGSKEGAIKGQVTKYLKANPNLEAYEREGLEYMRRNPSEFVPKKIKVKHDKNKKDIVNIKAKVHRVKHPKAKKQIQEAVQILAEEVKEIDQELKQIEKPMHSPPGRPSVPSQTHISALEDRINNHTEQINEIYNILESFDRGYKRTMERFDAYDNEIREVVDNVYSNKNEINQIIHRLNDSEMAIKELKQRSMMPDRDYEAAIMELGELNNQLVSSQQVNTNMLNSRIDEVDRYIKEYIKGYDQFKDDYGMRTRNLEAKYAIIDGLRAELDQIISYGYNDKLEALEQKLTSLENNPYATQKQLDDIAADINIQRVQIGDLQAEDKRISRVLNKHQMKMESMS